MNSPHDSRDHHGWTVRILQSLSGSPRPEEAVRAAAAVWLTAGQADSVTVVLFVSASRYVRATGGRSGRGEFEIGVDSGSESIAALFTPELYFSSHSGSAQEDMYLRPDRLAVCFVTTSSGEPPECVATTAAQILGRASTQQTLHPDTSQLESLAEFAAGAGHEINNPLGSIVGQSQLLLKQEQQTDRRQSLATIGAQAWRIRDMIGDCMLFARPPAPSPESCELNGLVREAAEKAALALDQSVGCLQFEIPDTPVTIEADATQIQTLVTHLVRNSIEACLNSDVAVQVVIGLEEDRNAVLLTVEDQAAGITDDQIRRHLFDPFYSGRQAGRGIGFGLPVCWQIVRSHGGLILAETPDGGGTRFVAGLPVVQSGGVS